MGSLRRCKQIWLIAKFCDRDIEYLIVLMLKWDNWTALLVRGENHLYFIFLFFRAITFKTSLVHTIHTNLRFAVIFHRTACSGVYFLLCMHSVCWVLPTRRTYRCVHAFLVLWIFNLPKRILFNQFPDLGDFSQFPTSQMRNDFFKILRGFLYWQKNFGLGLRILSSTGWSMQTGNHGLTYSIVH